MLFKVKIIFLRNSKDGFDQLLNWTGQCRLGLSSSQLKFILPEFLSLKPELCCPKFLVKTTEIVSYVTRNFRMLNNILTSQYLHIYCTCFVLAPVVQKVDNAIHQINLYPVDSAIHFPNTCIHWIMIYPVDSAIHLLNNRDLEEQDLLHSYLPCIVLKNEMLFYPNKPIRPTHFISLLLKECDIYTDLSE